MNFLSPQPTNLRTWLGSLVMLCCLTGCGKTAIVSGSVTNGKGEKLNSGLVAFLAADGEKGEAAISQDGYYTMTNAPIGEVKITVTVTDLIPKKGAAGGMQVPGGMPGPGSGMPAGGMAGAGDPTKVMKEEAAKIPNKGNISMGQAGMARVDYQIKPIKINPKYSNPVSSGLTHVVPRGKSTHDIVVP